MTVEFKASCNKIKQKLQGPLSNWITIDTGKFTFEVNNNIYDDDYRLSHFLEREQRRRAGLK